jgi:hypothetical protein
MCRECLLGYFAVVGTLTPKVSIEQKTLMMHSSLEEFINLTWCKYGKQGDQVVHVAVIAKWKLDG